MDIKQERSEIKAFLLDLLKAEGFIVWFGLVMICAIVLSFID